VSKYSGPYTRKKFCFRWRGRRWYDPNERKVIWSTLGMACFTMAVKILIWGLTSTHQTSLVAKSAPAHGIIGTAHHLYFSGTPAVVMALGASFSALEVVPLLFVGFEAWENLRLSRSTPWVRNYRWPIYFFVAVAFWNMVGAGLFGFMINPPVALYYMQGLNTTPVHGHAALFGVAAYAGATGECPNPISAPGGLPDLKVFSFASSGESVGDAGFRDPWEIAPEMPLIRIVSIDYRLLVAC